MNIDIALPYIVCAFVFLVYFAGISVMVFTLKKDNTPGKPTGGVYIILGLAFVLTPVWLPFFLIGNFIIELANMGGKK